MKWAIAFVAAFLIFDEIAFYWWRKVTPGLMYSVVNQPQPLFSSSVERPMRTAKSDINRFYPTR